MLSQRRLPRVAAPAEGRHILLKLRATCTKFEALSILVAIAWGWGGVKELGSWAHRTIAERHKTLGIPYHARPDRSMAYVHIAPV